jgi:hypothetical protein
MFTPQRTTSKEHVMTRQLAGVALLSLIAACGGSDPKPPGAFAGTFQFTGVYCNGGSGPPSQTATFVAPYIHTLVSPDGYSVTSTFTDGTCTIGVPLTQSYPSASTFSGRGSGAATTCVPSAAACASLSTFYFGGSLCGVASNEAESLWSFTAIPTVAGGTVTITATGGPAGYTSTCSNAGLAGPLTYTLTKL